MDKELLITIGELYMQVRQQSVNIEKMQKFLKQKDEEIERLEAALNDPKPKTTFS